MSRELNSRGPLEDKTNTGLRTAPWVVTRPGEEGRRLLLGRNLLMVSVAEDTDISGVGGVVGEAMLSDRTPVAVATKVADPNPQLLILDRGTSRGFLPRLESALRAKGVRVAPYESTYDRDIPVFVAGHIEQRRPGDLADPLLRERPLVWSFETPHGPHVGPLLENSEEFAGYLSDSAAFSDELLVKTHFADERPISLGFDEQDAEAVAGALYHLLSQRRDGLVFSVAAPDGDGFLLPSSLARNPLPWPNIDQLKWDFGLLRNVTVESFATPFGELWLASCRTPAGGMIPTLESNSGKGWNRSGALTTMSGEAVERAAAYAANSLADVPSGPDDIPLAEFAPFGPLWEARSGRVDRDERVSAEDLITGKSVTVPKVAVAFPYEPQGDRLRPSSGDTTGLAAYPTREGALTRALREVIERDRFYAGFLHQEQGFRLPPERIGSLTVHRFWYANIPFPSMHVVLEEREGGRVLLGRGSGSGCSWEEASDDALLEAFQILEQMRRGAPGHEGHAYDTWLDPIVQKEVIQYLDTMKLTSVPSAVEAQDDEFMLESILSQLENESRRALAVWLPSPVLGMHAVRVLVPGASTNIYPSSGAGGRRLASARWTHGLPV